jgi:uncharacterized protein (UPF0276 family)
MTTVQTLERRHQSRETTLALGTTYEGTDPLFMERVLPSIRYIEVGPDSVAEMVDGRPVFPQEKMEELARVATQADVIVHGIGLSIASHEGVSGTYLELLDTFFSRIPVRWHSEHLGYVKVDGEPIGTMLAVPKTEQMLDLLCERVRKIQETYPLPFLLENIVHVLPDCPGDYSDAAFLNELTSRTGCGLILDIYNLECDAYNHGFSIPDFLAELNLQRVREMHLAGGVIYKGFRLDVHTQPNEDSTLQLAKQVLAHSPNVEAIIYELLPEAVPKIGYEPIRTELERVKAALIN